MKFCFFSQKRISSVPIYGCITVLGYVILLNQNGITVDKPPVDSKADAEQTPPIKGNVLSFISHKVNGKPLHIEKIVVSIVVLSLADEPEFFKNIKYFKCTNLIHLGEIISSNRGQKLCNEQAQEGTESL